MGRAIAKGWRKVTPDGSPGTNVQTYSLQLDTGTLVIFVSKILREIERYVIPCVTFQHR